MFKFVVRREFWYRGNGSEESNLVLRNGKMCCLGFLGLACGIDEELMVGIGSPDDLESWPARELWPIKIRPVVEGNSDLTNNLMFVNDNDEPGYTDKQRESKLKELFATADIEVVFE